MCLFYPALSPSAHNQLFTVSQAWILLWLFQLVKIRLSLFIKINKKTLEIVCVTFTQGLIVSPAKHIHISTTGLLILQEMEQAIGSTNQSTFKYLLLYRSVHPCSLACCTAGGAVWGACLAWSCDLNVNLWRAWKHWGSYYLHGWLWRTAHGVWATNRRAGLCWCD